MNNEVVATLTDKDYWEDYWENSFYAKIPEEIGFNTNKYSESLYIPFHKFMNKDKELSVLEIGGAPGLFISSLTKIHSNLSLGVLDYTEKGRKETEYVFSKYNLEGVIHNRDLFRDELSDIPEYDVVYSLGVVEHYDDIEASLNKHLECAKNGGVVIIGLPVFLGINDWLVSKFAPNNRDTWYPFIMDKKSWQRFTNREDIEILFDDYVGGFNPHVHHRLEDKNSVWKKGAYIFLHKYFAKIWDRLPYTNRINSKYFSFYYYFAVKKTGNSPSF